VAQQQTPAFPFADASAYGSAFSSFQSNRQPYTRILAQSGKEGWCPPDLDITNPVEHMHVYIC